jgi:hypothetical protein
MAVKQIAHPSVEERQARGKEARTPTPLSAHAGWEANASCGVTGRLQATEGV